MRVLTVALFKGDGPLRKWSWRLAMTIVDGPWTMDHVDHSLLLACDVSV